MTSQEFDNLTIELRPTLLAVASRFLADGEGAEDCVQDCLVKLWNMRSQLDEARSVTALAKVIVRNQCLDVLKRPSNRSVSVDEIDNYYSDSRLPDRLLEGREDAKIVNELMDELTGNVRVVMKMRHVQGFDIDEISEQTGWSVENIRVNISRGRKRLRELFERRI